MPASDITMRRALPEGAHAGVRASDDLSAEQPYFAGEATGLPFSTM